MRDGIIRAMMNRECDRPSPALGTPLPAGPARNLCLREHQVALDLVPGLVTDPVGRIRRCVLGPDPCHVLPKPRRGTGPSHPFGDHRRRHPEIGQTQPTNQCPIFHCDHPSNRSDRMAQFSTVRMAHFSTVVRGRSAWSGLKTGVKQQRVTAMELPAGATVCSCRDALGPVQAQHPVHRFRWKPGWSTSATKSRFRGSAIEAPSKNELPMPECHSVLTTVVKRSRSATACTSVAPRQALSPLHGSCCSAARYR